MSYQDWEDEYMAGFGDPRRCRFHGVVTSSPDGLYDTPCGVCESSETDMLEAPVKVVSAPMPVSFDDDDILF